MKKQISIIILILSSYFSNGQNWQWAKQIGGIGNDGAGICLDKNNNIYTYGNFSFNCYFNTDTFISNGVNDFFLAKYDDSGNEIWAKSFGGFNSNGYYEFAGSVTIDSSGNAIYLSGSFYGTLWLDTFSITTNGGSDIFLAKLNSSGNCVWLKKIGSNSDDDAFAMQLDPNGNILFTGTLKGSAQFDSFSIAAGGFLSKYDTSGNCLWAAKKFSGAYFSCIKYLGNDLIMTGTTTNDTAVVDTAVLISSSITDALIGRFDSSGNVKWIKRNGGTFDDYGSWLGLDSLGNIYNSGFFKDSMGFNGVSLTNGNRYDMYLAKLNSNDGNLIWIRQSNAFGNNYGAQASLISTDLFGNSYITGSFGGTATLGNFTLTTANFQDMFVARYDSAGNCIGAENFGPAQGFGVFVDGNGSLLLSGVFNNTVNIGGTTLTSYGQNDMYIAKHDAITGTHEGERKSNQLLIYANPNQGKCNITIPDEFKQDKNLTLSIYANDGKLIQQKKIEMDNDKIKLNLEAEAKGVYNVTLSNGLKSYRGKIVFE